MDFINAALPKGSLILVTGAAGYIGANVVHEALDAGYKVRGTSRSEERAEDSKKTFKQDPNYSTAVVKDFQREGAFDDAVKDCNAIIHVASDTSFGHDPNVVVKPMVDGILSILRSSAKTPSVKRFVLTSSSVAVLLPSSEKEITVSVHDWNHESIDAAWAPPPYTPDRAFAVYAASKIEGEKAFWDFVKNEKPSFVANTVLPNFNMGRILTSGGPTGTAPEALLKGSVPQFPPQYHIDVVDDARIHLIAAALDSSIENERIFAFNTPFNWTEAIQIIRQLRPDVMTVAAPPENEANDLSKVPNELGARLLKKWYGQESGYKSLKQSISEGLA